jgi:hypothetical protein
MISLIWESKKLCCTTNLIKWKKLTFDQVWYDPDPAWCEFRGRIRILSKKNLTGSATLVGKQFFKANVNVTFPLSVQAVGGMYEELFPDLNTRPEDKVCSFPIHICQGGPTSVSPSLTNTDNINHQVVEYCLGLGDVFFFFFFFRIRIQLHREFRFQIWIWSWRDLIKLVRCRSLPLFV